MKSSRELWEACRTDTSRVPALGLSVDLSRLDGHRQWAGSLRDAIDHAWEEMADVERGAVVNVDEKRRVGHYWLRDPRRAPTADDRAAIEQTIRVVRTFASKVHRGTVRGQKRRTFSDVLVIGIGGSALGPQLVADALGTSRDRLTPWFIDNTDPDGMDRAFQRLDGRLDRTLVLVISKSGETKETRNGMKEAEARWRRAGLSFARHAVAITGDGSELDKYRTDEGWIAQFPMWDWVGGRTSVMSAVGLLPAALQGIDIKALLSGARAADEVTRVRRDDPFENPAMALALAWHFATGGRGAKDMVILPYKDRLALFARYLQQLVMESLGKEFDRQGAVVRQGISVYGNKGSTDQHAYVQQLRDGVHNFFVTFIEVLRDRGGRGLAVEPQVTSGDYLSAFLQGTRKALYESNRGSITITVPEVSAATLGGLIALYERAVGFYAGLVNINAYHQPGVQAGKVAATGVLDLQKRVLDHLEKTARRPETADEIAAALGVDEVETVFRILEHAAANPEHRVGRREGTSPFDARYHASKR